MTRHLVRGVALEDDVLQGVPVVAHPGPLLDGALDDVAGHAGLARLLQGGEEPGVGGRVGAAELGGDRDLLHHLPHHLPLLQVDDRAFRVEPLASHETATASSRCPARAMANRPENDPSCPEPPQIGPVCGPGGPRRCWRAGSARLTRCNPPPTSSSIGDEVAIAWSDGAESFLRHDLLRRASPSAENQGEHDVFGNQYGGAGRADYSGVRVLGWESVGNYALRFDFSDGHRTGLYTSTTCENWATSPPP